jgi:hypothetical protein
MSRLGFGSTAAPARPQRPGTVGVGRRTAVAVGLFVLALAVTWLADRFVGTVPQAVAGAWLAAAAAGAMVYALTMPWRGAASLAVVVALAVGVLTYSHPVRDRTAHGVTVVGSTVGGWLHPGGAG